jgi:signal transduction histidine kinase
MASSDLEQASGQLQSIAVGERPPRDEIDRLTITFKQLIDRIQSQITKLKQADSLRRELVTNVSHDLRTPLATLQGYIETLFLKDKSLSADDRKHHLEIAIQHCERLSKLVNELFELAKLDSNEIRVRYEPFNISELVHDVVQKFDLSAQEKQLYIHIDLDPDLPFVNADIAMIERVIENLLENAVRHTPAGGSIRLEISPENKDIAVGVSDTGCGIPGEDLPFIFDRFYRREKTPSGKTGYSGLGLAIARRILELHDKPIRVESTPGSGTTFTFLLPAHHPA